MLETEVEIAKEYGANDMSPNNYDFCFIREEHLAGRRCYVLELRPRRKDKNLVRGSIWVDADTYLLHRTEGEPAKSLSWWVRDVRMVFFMRCGGWVEDGSRPHHVRILANPIVSDVNTNRPQISNGPQQPRKLVVHWPVRTEERLHLSGK